MKSIATKSTVRRFDGTLVKTAVLGSFITVSAVVLVEVHFPSPSYPVFVESSTTDSFSLSSSLSALDVFEI